MAEEEPWLSLTEAAQRSGLAREAIRARARRNLIPSRKGNDGRLLVQIPAGLMAEVGQGMAGLPADLLADLTAEVAELRTALARAEAEADTAKAVAEAKIVAARDAAEARIAAAGVEVAAIRELADRLTAELAEARRPWWRKIF